MNLVAVRNNAQFIIFSTEIASESKTIIETSASVALGNKETSMVVASPPEVIVIVEKKKIKTKYWT